MVTRWISLDITVSWFVVIFVDGGKDMTFVAKELHSLSVKAKGNSILEVLKIK